MARSRQGIAKGGLKNAWLQSNARENNGGCGLKRFSRESVELRISISQQYELESGWAWYGPEIYDAFSSIEIASAHDAID